MDDKSSPKKANMYFVIIWLVKECVMMGLITVISFSENLMGKPAKKNKGLIILS